MQLFTCALNLAGHLRINTIGDVDITLFLTILIYFARFNMILLYFYRKCHGRVSALFGDFLGDHHRLNGSDISRIPMVVSVQ